jgi:flagellar biosynthesis GTPase FlhF
LELLGSYREYNQYRSESGEWDRETLRATLDAKHIAAREILMQEDPLEHAQTTLDELQPRGVDEPLRLEDWVPGESFATYYGRKADVARRAQKAAEEYARQAEEYARQAEEHARQAEEHARQAEHDKRQAEHDKRQAEHDKRQAQEDNSKLAVVAKFWVAQQRLQGRSDSESASELGYSLEEFLTRFPTV